MFHCLKQFEVKQLLRIFIELKTLEVEIKIKKTNLKRTYVPRVQIDITFKQTKDSKASNVCVKYGNPQKITI